MEKKENIDGKLFLKAVKDVISSVPPSRKGKSACDKNNYYLAAVSALTDGKEVTATRKMMHGGHADKLQQMEGSFPTGMWPVSQISKSKWHRESLFCCREVSACPVSKQDWWSSSLPCAQVKVSSCST